MRSSQKKTPPMIRLTDLPSHTCGFCKCVTYGYQVQCCAQGVAAQQKERALLNNGNSPCGALIGPEGESCGVAKNKCLEHVTDSSISLNKTVDAHEHPPFPWRAVPVRGREHLVNIISDAPRDPCDFTEVVSGIWKDGWLHRWLLGAEERERRTGSAQTLTRLAEWTREYGAALKPKGADTYGEGVRDCKAQVASILAAPCASPVPPYREDMRRIGEALGLHENVSDVGHILGAIDELREQRTSAPCACGHSDADHETERTCRICQMTCAQHTNKGQPESVRGVVSDWAAALILPLPKRAVENLIAVLEGRENAVPRSGEDQPAVRGDKRTLPCIRCSKPLTSALPDEPWGQINQPNDGLSLSSPGHYGSTVHDPGDGSTVELNVCDPCLDNAIKHGIAIVEGKQHRERDQTEAHQPGEFAQPCASTVQEPELDSPNFVPDSLKDLATRDYKRVHRWDDIKHRGPRTPRTEAQIVEACVMYIRALVGNMANRNEEPKEWTVYLDNVADQLEAGAWRRHIDDPKEAARCVAEAEAEPRTSDALRLDEPETFDAAQRSGDDPRMSGHVCGLMGFGRPEDVCVACEKRRERDQPKPKSFPSGATGDPNAPREAQATSHGPISMTPGNGEDPRFEPEGRGQSTSNACAGCPGCRADRDDLGRQPPCDLAGTPTPGVAQEPRHDANCQSKGGPGYHCDCERYHRERKAYEQVKAAPSSGVTLKDELKRLVEEVRTVLFTRPDQEKKP